MSKEDKKEYSSYFIPADELGLDLNDFVIDENHWYNEMYELYKDSCHHEHSLDEKLTREDYVEHDKINEHTFSAMGRVGIFRWYALTLYYDKTIHKLDEAKIKHNKNHQDTVCDIILSNPGNNLLDAINNENELVNILQHNPIVANTAELFESWDSEKDCMAKEHYFLGNLENLLNVFLDLGERGVFKKEGKTISIDRNIIKGKDVVLPFIWANRKNLDLYGKLAKKCIENGANTVVGIFASRQVPSMDGREAETIPQEYEPDFTLTFSFNICF